ncbi:hypothetical protein QYE76_061255 [Lolium multiflorum]|uniref:Retrotransposon gag domain-containing protein n=1 Tax=Lolium multiflorum TaxID=4521 RepID=A0AAD8S1J2_LOLMU|nr:hypothetical protein QYE76_061255 [Lolium multiflorum]
MAQAHRGALESLAILGNNLVPQKERTMVQGSGSKHHARDARDDITQSRVDKARRRRATRKDDDSDSSDEDQAYDGELRGADCLSYKIREAMPPKKFKPTPTDAAKYDGQQEPRPWALEGGPPIDDYLQTVILHKGNQIAAMQCLQLYLKDSARAWLWGLPKGSIKSWDDLVDTFVANFQATYKRPVGIEELRNCRQKQKESMRSYIGRFTKLLNDAEDVSVDRAIDDFSDGVQRESYIEELGRKKPKTITKLMEIANSWADGGSGREIAPGRITSPASEDINPKLRDLFSSRLVTVEATQSPGLAIEPDGAGGAGAGGGAFGALPFGREEEDLAAAPSLVELAVAAVFFFFTIVRSEED